MQLSLECAGGCGVEAVLVVPRQSVTPLLPPDLPLSRGFDPKAPRTFHKYFEVGRQ